MNKIYKKKSGSDIFKMNNSNNSSKSPNKIIKKFMEDLMTTEKLLLEKKNKTKGLVKIRLALSPKDINNLDASKVINTEFNAVVKNLLKNTNNKPLKFLTKPSGFSKK
jgi:hypothetical protein